MEGDAHGSGGRHGEADDAVVVSRSPERQTRLAHDPIAKTGAWMKRMLLGHLNYFAVSGDHPSLWWFSNKVRRLWLMSLRRRSQKAHLSWEKFDRLVARFFPPIRTLHAQPGHRFDAKTRGRSPVR